MTPYAGVVLGAMDRRALAWVRHRVRVLLSAAKRRRKYLPHQAAFSPEELADLQALLDLERAVGVLLATPSHDGVPP